MTKEQFMVRDFMTLFKQERYLTPTIPSLACRKLRAKLMIEETLETIQKGLGLELLMSFGEVGMIQFPRSENAKFDFVSTEFGPSLIETADGLGDSHYVGYCGTGEAFGINMEPVFAEIHRSNMTKLWSKEQLDFGIKTYSGCEVEDYGGGLFRLLYQGKVIKSPTYSPANVKLEIEKQLHG